ncbi:hypothetical protein EON65_17820, partial [archaeon]
MDQAEKSELALDAADILADDIKTIDEESSNSAQPAFSSKLRSAIFQLQQKGKSRLTTIKSSYLYQIGMPEKEDIKTYGGLFHHLVKQGMIPLGILRGTFSILSLGPMSNRLPYVFANPPKEAEVFSCDKVFVLSLKPVGVNAQQGLRDVVADLQAQRGGRGRSSSDEIAKTRLLNSRPGSGGKSRSRPGSASKHGTDRSADEMNNLLNNVPVSNGVNLDTTIDSEIGKRAVDAIDPMAT